MRCFRVSLLLALAKPSQASIQEPSSSRTADLQDSFADRLVNRQMPPALDSVGLDATTLDKAGQSAVPTSRASLPSAIHAPSLRTARLPSQIPLRARPAPRFVVNGEKGLFSLPLAAGVSASVANGKQAAQDARQSPLATAEGVGAASVAEDVPYSINFFVDGDMSHADGMDPDGYMKRKISDALKTTQSKIEAVDVRLTIEGHSPKTYRFEVTVKGPKGSTGTSVVSKSKHAHATFPEAVDDMHDTLKRNLLKDKEKRVSKVRRGASLRDSGIADDDAALADDSDDEESQFVETGTGGR